MKRILLGIGLALIGLPAILLGAALFWLGYAPEAKPTSPPADQLARAATILADPRWTPPAGWTFGEYTRPDGVTLRFGSAQAPSPEAPIFVYVPGFTNIIEQGYEFLSDLHERGITVYSIELRGQGGSTRGLPGAENHQKSWLRDFRTYAEDLTGFLSEETGLRRGGPVILGGLSLGGHAVLRTAVEFPDSADAFALIAPAVGLRTAPFDAKGALLLAQSVSFIGGGKHYVPGHGPRSWGPERLDWIGACGSDPARASGLQAWAIARSETRMGGGTFDWLKAFLKSAALVRESENLARISAPILLINPLADATVLPEASTSACKAIKNCRELAMADTQHCPFTDPHPKYDAALDALSGFILAQVPPPIIVTESATR